MFSGAPFYSLTSFSGIRRPRREINNSLPSSAEVKNAWRYTSTPLTWLYAAGKENFISLFTFYPLSTPGLMPSQTSTLLVRRHKRPECAAEHSYLLHSHNYTALYLLKYRDILYGDILYKRHILIKCEKRQILGVFAKFVMSVCPPVRPSSWNNLAPTWRIFVIFDTWVFLKI